ncbi:MAG TPA: Rieske (2Fe-2S) protein [Candidatus Hydrogenedentes bacterium]|nr:Rieske (2Fe-2S) protein [Candidatus Hydrogenedentota bacterium]HNT89477.1 Rieske (2Fe-2S) protein [Candidatus Hydrogenedentota bacterium]
MDYVKLASRKDFEGKPMRVYRVLTRPVAVFREADGSFRAMEIGCRHQGADLSTGSRQGDVVTCPRHGWQYDLRTGDCLRGGDAPLRRYAVKVEGDDIYVSLRPIDTEASAD